jgi:hypothetical protein
MGLLLLLLLLRVEALDCLIYHFVAAVAQAQHSTQHPCVATWRLANTFPTANRLLACLRVLVMSGSAAQAV